MRNFALHALLFFGALVPLNAIATDTQTVRADHGVTLQLPTWMDVTDSKTTAALEQIARDSAAARGMATPSGRRALLSASGRDITVRLIATNPAPLSQAEINALRTADIQQLENQLESQVRQTGTSLVGGVKAYTSDRVAGRRSFIYEYQRSTLLGANSNQKLVVVYQLVSGNNLVEMTVSLPAGDQSALAVLGQIQKSLQLP